MLQRDTVPSRPEERFVELFQEVFGPAAAALLQPQVHFRDIRGQDRYIDFALDSLLDRSALEIDGETYHHPAAVTPEDYESQLLRQNSLIHQGWRVFRWTDRQIADRPEDVKEDLTVLVGTTVRLAAPQEHLPAKRAALIDLHDHQAVALARLDAMRRDGIAVALLAHAVGSGKTATAVEDSRAVGKRTLMLAHTEELVTQALDEFARLWPEATRARLGQPGDDAAQVVVGTVQYMAQHLAEYGEKDFGYIVIDEAHHATARTYRAVLRYFDPDFLLGLTATPDRADGESALEVFRNTAHHMDLETAVRSGILCDVRCFRVQTNVDLTRVRFNGAFYNQKDLEVRVSVPERNRLIAETYAENVPGRPAVAFCVSVDHAEEMARLFRAAGFPAEAVSGRLSKEDRRAALARYEAGEVTVLCACDVLNEGWDAPQTAVLLMARPTLSKVIYQQQIGRGMRTYPGKKYLVLFDFVDAFSRHNEAMSIHRLLRKAQYKPGSRMFGDDQPGDAEELPLHLWATGYTPVNVFDWQEQVSGMLTAPALSTVLRKDPQWVGDKWRSGEIAADEVIELGDDRRIPYFKPERAAELRARYGIAEVTDDNLYEAFAEFLADMDMTRSYKPAWFLAVLGCVDDNGRASVAEVTQSFRRFYQERAAAGLVAEASGSPLADPSACTDADVRHAINRGPFERFSRLGYIAYARDAAYYQIAKPVWQRLKQPAEREKAAAACRAGIEAYYRRPGLAGL